MSKLVVVAIKDRAMDAFTRPMFVPAVGVAVRLFRDEANKPGTPVNQHPEDFDMYELGLWCEQTGMFECGVPRLVTLGRDVVVSSAEK